MVSLVFLVFFTKIMHLFASGSVHQGHEMFGQESRGRQCAFMAFSSILYEQKIPVSAWSLNTIDSIMVNADMLYLSALRSQRIPDAASLSLKNLPRIVRWCSNNRSIVTLVCMLSHINVNLHST